MIKKIFFFLILFLNLLEVRFLNPLLALTKGDILVMDDFNIKKMMNKRNGAIGTWKSNPNDTSQWCEIAHDGQTYLGQRGASLKVNYNVESYMKTYVESRERISSQEHGFHAIAFNGIYMGLQKLDTTPFRYFVFSVRGDPAQGYTRKFKVEFKDDKRSISYYVDGITSDWKRFFIPLRQFAATINLKELQEIVFVFDSNVTLGKGTLYLDELYFATSMIEIEDYYDYLESLEIAQSQPAPDPIPQPPPLAEIPDTLSPLVDQALQREQEEIESAAKAAQLEVRRDEKNVMVTTYILFETNKAIILDSEFENLRKVAQLIKDHPNFYVEIHGHTDSVGGEEYNFNLSLNRAKTVKKYLAEVERLESDHLMIYGWGLKKPVDTNETEEGRAKNRRVEFIFQTMPTFPAYSIKNEIEIDGNLTEWQNVESLRLNGLKYLESGKITNEDDFSDEIFFQFDQKNLYFAAKVKDNEVVCLRTNKYIYIADVIELFIDPNNDNFFWGNLNDFQIGLAPSGPEKTPQTWAWFQNRKPASDEIQIASKLIPGGYQIEAAISFKFLSLSLAENVWQRYEFNSLEPISLGMSIALHDLDLEDKTREAKLNWHFIKNPKNMEQIQLGILNLIKI